MLLPLGEKEELGLPLAALSLSEYLRAYARQPARGVKSGGWGAKAAIVVVVVAVVVVVGDGVVGGVAVIVAVVVCVNINVMLGQHSPR